MADKHLSEQSGFELKGKAGGRRYIWYLILKDPFKEDKSGKSVCCRSFFKKFLWNLVKTKSYRCHPLRDGICSWKCSKTLIRNINHALI
jgi:hypothetical protein